MSNLPLLPFGAAPSPRQLRWHSLEYYGFIHFTVNTFTNREWGRGDEAPSIFQPRNFSANQIAETAAEGGMKGLILTAKHHDGFCLWPSDYNTTHSVKNTPWMGGKCDVVEAMARACQDAGIKFGIYLSPWDRNHPDYARDGYITYYHNQLRELLTRYGLLFEVWFDGANGGDGYYGGKYEKRTIDAHTYYRWDEIFGIVRDLQPDAVIFGGEPGADIRWVGNESGIAGDPCWHTFDTGMGENAGIDVLNHGVRSGQTWFPAECDVSIRPGWFFHQRENKLVRSPQNLLDLFFQSAGRGSSLLLNLPPDRNGRVHSQDVQSVMEFKKLREQLFARNLAKEARISASNVRSGSEQFSAMNVVDASQSTFWCTDDEVLSPELILDFDRPVTVNLASVREHLPLGQRVDELSIDVFQGDRWHTLVTAQSIGNRRLLKFSPVKAERYRLRILRAAACPAIQEFGLYFAEGR